MIRVEPSINNPDTHFKLNGLEYNKDHYTLFYRNISLVNGEVDKSNVKVGLRSKFNLMEILVSPTEISYWSDGTSNFVDLDTLGTYLVGLINVDPQPPFDPTVFPDDDLVGGFVTGFQSDINRVKPTDKTNQSGPTSLQAYDGTGHGTGTSNGVRGDYIRGDNANRSYWVESAPEWDFGANINDPFTVSVWFKVTSTGDVQFVIMNGQVGSGRSFQINTNATVLNVWVFSNISTPNTDRLRHQVPLADITLNTWHNVVATGQGTDEANYKAWFNKTLIDGTTYGTRAVDGTFSGPAALVNQELYVSGSDIISANHGLRGNFDEIYLYKRLANQTFVNNLYDKIDGIPKFGFGESNNGINPVQGFYKVDSAGKKVFIADKYIVGGNPRLNSPGSYCSGDVMLHGFILKENSYHRMGVWYQKGSQDPKLSIPFDVPADDDNPALPADIFNHPLPVVIVDPNDNKIIAIQSAKHNTVCRIAKSTATIAQIANYTTEQFRQMAWDRLPDMVGNASGRYAYPSARFRPDGVLEIDFRTTFSVTDNYSLTRVYSDSNTINGSTVWTEKVWGLTNFTTTNRRYYPNACWNFGTCTGFISPIAIREDANTRYRAIGAVRRPFSDYNSHQNIAGTFTKNVTNTGADTTNALTESEIVTNCLVTGDPTTAAQTSTGSMIQYNDVVYLIARDHDNDLDNVILFRQAVGSATVNTVALPADFDGCQPNDISMASWLWADVTNDKIVIRASNQVSGNVEYWQINSDLTGGWSKIIDAAGIPILPINTEDLTAPYSGPVSSALNAEETTYATQATKIFVASTGLNPADCECYISIDRGIIDDKTGNHAPFAAGVPLFVNNIYNGDLSESLQITVNPQRVQIPYSANFAYGNGTNDLPFSLSMTVNFLAINPNQNWMFTLRNYTGGSLALDFLVNTAGAAGQFQFLRRSTVGNMSTRSTIVPVAGTNYHVTYTDDGSGLAGAGKMYINGVDNTSTSTLSGSYVTTDTNTEPLIIGGPTSSSIADMQGAFNTFSWWNVELTPAQVLELYNIEKNGGYFLP